MKTIVVLTKDEHIVRAMCEFVRTVLPEVCEPPVQVLPACSADDLLDILAKQSIDLLMIDHLLPDMTGLDLIRWLGTALRGTVKILLTNDSRVLADPWNYLGTEVNSVLARPLGREPLKRVLKTWAATLAPQFGRPEKEPRTSRAQG
jgi:CheY-like chemotaxis protein